MKTISCKDALGQLDTLLHRDQEPGAAVRPVVLDIIENVKTKGDTALIEYAKKFDGAELSSLRVSDEELKEAIDAVDPALLEVYREAAQNIREFHEKQLEETWTYEARPGVLLGQKITPLERVGLYVPGGKAAYPSTVLMDAIPALTAGVKSLAMVTPPARNGKIDPHILAAAQVAGVHEIYKTGGAQAVAALAYGTDSIAPVVKIVGPGNIFVATAKREVFGKVAIDMIAGPSEVLVLADESASAEWIAADMLSQAEHDEMAMPILVTTAPALAEAVEAELSRQIDDDLTRKEIARASVRDYGLIFTADNLDEAFEIANRIAPEHMEIMLPDAQQYLDRVQNAGAIFLGSYTPEPVGDYFAGPNHTLPTSGSAKFSSPLGVYDFQKRSSILRYEKEAVEKIADSVAAFANSEGLDAHARSVLKRGKNA